MTDEFEQLKKNIKSITSQEFNTSFCLVGKIVNYTPNMEYCDVEVDVNNGTFVFPNIPAHGYPVKGSTGIIHFHNGNLEQPVCDCAYRLNPPEETLREYYQSNCFNWANNGDFSFGGEGYSNGTNTEIKLVEETNTSGSEQCAILEKYGDYIEFNVNLSQCTTEYFKFQCYYMGNGTLKVECWNTDTNTVIQNIPYSLSYPYKLWESPYGRRGWAYNKEVYPYLSLDRQTTNENIKIRLTNYTQNVQELEYNNKVFDEYDENKISQATEPHSILVDGILVYSECDDKTYYNSEDDMMKQYTDKT